MSEDYAQGSAAEIERKVKQWHELKPAAILITMSSSYGPVVAIKEAWKKAYPHDIIPPFVTVDPRYIKRAGIAKESIEKPRYKETPQEYDENLYQKVLQKRDEIEKKLGKVLKKDPYSERILVFDETGPPAVDSTDEDSDRGSRKKVIMGPENAKTKSSYFFGRVGNNSLYYTGLLLSKPEKVVLNPTGDQPDLKKYSDVWMDTIWEGVGVPYLAQQIGNKVIGRDRSKSIEYSRSNTNTPRMVAHGSVGMAHIKKLKEIGREVGNKMREKRERDLETRLFGITAISALSFSIIFATNITGNITSTLNKPISNTIGIILFFTNLVFGFLWYRKKQG